MATAVLIPAVSPHGPVAKGSLSVVPRKAHPAMKEAAEEQTLQDNNGATTCSITTKLVETCTFGPGATGFVTVPPGVTTGQLTLYGGHGSDVGGAQGGTGGKVTGTLEFTKIFKPTTKASTTGTKTTRTLYLSVGHNGGVFYESPETAYGQKTNSYGGGFAGQGGFTGGNASSTYGGGGGGSAFVSVADEGYRVTKPLAVAGGGGGAGGWNSSVLIFSSA